MLSKIGIKLYGLKKVGLHFPKIYCYGIMLLIFKRELDLMNQNDYSLYRILSNLKNNLQIKFYDRINQRKPLICSDDTLRLLVRYKPTTLYDLSNINGVGESFINNYSEYFLFEIKKFIGDEKVEISEQEKIILSKLENRLVNINRKNRLLYCGKLNKEYCTDLFNLVKDIDELEKFLISRNGGSLKIIEINDFDDSKVQSVLRLIRTASKIENETGNNELYIAYPFIQGKMEEENFNVKAPLLLFPVLLERNLYSISLKNDFSRDILYNTTLILANNKFNNKNEVLPDNAVEEFSSTTYIKDIINFYNENKFYIKYHNCSIEKFLENKSNEFPKYKNGELEIKKYMVLGIYSTYVTSMYEDFHNIIQNNDITKLIKELLWGIENGSNSIDENYNEEDLNQNVDKIEDEIDYINELDFSQEKVLKEINKSNSIVIQGPPGTGKSQTITSIIAQCILQGKKILMVSEKKTALDVIYSRLGELSKFVMLIDDVENKQEFYSQLDSISNYLHTNNITHNFVEAQKQISKYIMEKIRKIDDDMDCLEKISSKIYAPNNLGTSMFNIYSLCKKYDFANEEEIKKYREVFDEITQPILSCDFTKVSRIKSSFDNTNISNSVDSYYSINYENYPFNFLKSNLVDIELAEFKQKVDNLYKYLNDYNNLPSYKKITKYFRLKTMANNIIDDYFYNNDFSSKQFINCIPNLKSVLNNYQQYVSNKFMYEKLDYYEREYIKIVENVKEKRKCSFKEASDEVYNAFLFNIISNFEKNNVDVLNYINNFDSIRNDIKKNIIEKKDLIKELTYIKLFESTLNLECNNKINKIEEMCNRKRKMAINKFMKKYKLEMLDSIKIWLMTPEVVSDILPLEKNTFDIVIFDEASQLYVEKSIPAIYRSNKVVIAGDLKQLKPSSLGQGRILDEPDEMDDEISDGFLDYESLLDAARFKFKHTMLSYHYRSKYEELIAFSNYAFYDGKLIVTSVANKTEEKPIERIKVDDGLWIDKKNVAEAKCVVKKLKEILKSRKNNETIGVITFNSSQMTLIEDLIEKEKAKDDEFAMQMIREEKRFSNGENVSFFVKNIESVQGDERDIIIFCIGYAKNEKGRVAINFGWLNQDGGENRLNVAISRAKQKIYVVTSIEPEELIVDYTKNNGPKLFKKYLEYVKALNDENYDLVKSILYSLLDKNDLKEKQLTFDSVFEEEVCNKLLEYGYKVETQYGVGGYRIDLVVKSKDGKSNLLGIECDGRLYHSTKSARERDYHRQKYLESRDWKIYRIWSTNWWKNSELEFAKLRNFIEKIDISNN